MKILQIFNRYLQRGGEDNSVDRIARQIEEDGISLERLEFRSDTWQAERSKLEQVASLFYNREAAQRIEMAHRRFQPDLWLVHNLWPGISPSIYQEALRLDAPILQYLHNWRPLSVDGTLSVNGMPPQAPVHRRYLREALEGRWQNSVVKTSLLAAAMRLPALTGWDRAIKGWVVISDFMRDRLLENAWPADRTYALRHSFDIRPAPPTRDDGFYLLLARLIPEKGVSVLLDAWQLLEKQGSAPQLLVGGTGPLAEMIKDAAGLYPSIRYVGQVDGAQKADLLACCRAIVAPALWWEPLGITPYEAYENEKPMLAASAGGLTETVIHGETGLLHSPGDAAQLAADVRQMENNPALTLEMGRRGRQWLELNASHEKWRTDFRAIVEKTLSSHA